MDGFYSNHILNLRNFEIENPEKILTGKNKTKILQQKYEIINALKNNKKSFWLNTAGLKEFLKDLKE